MCIRDNPNAARGDSITGRNQNCLETRTGMSPTVGCDVENSLIDLNVYVCGTICRTLKYKTRNETTYIEVYAMEAPVTLCEIEREKDRRQPASAEMKFLRDVVVDCTLIYIISNEHVRKELEIFNLENKINKYKINWCNHLERKMCIRDRNQIMFHIQPCIVEFSRPIVFGEDRLKEKG